MVVFNGFWKNQSLVENSTPAKVTSSKLADSKTGHYTRKNGNQ